MRPAPDIVIDVAGLTKSFGARVVVKDLTLQVRRGQIYGFLGPNGSGKTTTIRMLCGLLTPDNGSGTCLGYDILTQSHLIKRRVGYMTQRFSLYQDLSIREKQRLALGACILPQPDLLLLDEPTAGVDPKARRDFWNEIHALASEGLTVLVSTHYMDEAERCHEIAYIAYGALLAHGPVDAVVRAAGLQTWRVEGQDLHALAAQLLKLPGVEMVAPFGASLHVGGRDHTALEAAIAPWRCDPRYVWRADEPSLEDVFIDLMNRAQDNFP